MAVILSNIGDVHYKKSELIKASECLEKSYSILIKESDVIFLAEIANKLGKVKFMNNEFEKAKEYYFSAANKLHGVCNKYYLIDVLVNLAQLEERQSNNDAILYLQQAVNYAEEISAKKKISEIFQMLSNHYEKKEDYKTAMEYFQKYHFIEQEIEASNLTDKLQMLKIEFDYFREKNRYCKFKKINQRLEFEIFNEKNKLEHLKNINEKLKKKALTDELTGIFNRRMINKYLKQIWKEENKRPIFLLIIDIDRFKFFNDSQGHLKGDGCLIKIANCLKNIQIERNDFLGRYGGEEFLYITENISYEEALKLGLRLENAVENLGIKHIENSEYSCVTVSVGGAYGYVSDFKSIADMIEIADKELYRAKNMGRNRLCLCNVRDSKYECI